MFWQYVKSIISDEAVGEDAVVNSIRLPLGRIEVADEDLQKQKKRTAARRPPEPLGGGRAHDDLDTAPIPRNGAVSSLPPTAQKFLHAARRLLYEGGFDALRLEAIAKEAGENRALIRYYFGGKDGLIAALVDMFTHDATVSLVNRCEALPKGEERVHVYLDNARSIVEDRDSFQTFYDVLPHAARDSELRTRIADLYEWYREINERCLGVHPDVQGYKRLSALAMIVLAAVDGLAVQVLLDPDLDVKPCFKVLESIVANEVQSTSEI